MTYLVWIGFLIFILVMVLLDLGVFHRRAHEVSVREALAWTCVWIALALVFNVCVYFLYETSPGSWASLEMHPLTGREAATQFFTGYVLEKSLSMDNIFVIAMIFAYFSVPLKNQHRLLFWGIMGAVVLRGIMIALGAALIARFDWIIYVFGGLLLVSAAKMMIAQTENIAPEKNLVVRLVRRLYPVTHEIDSGRFFVRLNGQWAATPLFLALILIETSDILFAVDSIPAVFAVTRDPFLVFTSNIFAILGLRSMYFVLAGFMHQFRYLKTSLVFVLAYVGVKMMLSHHYPIPNLASLAIIAGILAVGILASLIAAGRESTGQAGAAVPVHPQRRVPLSDPLAGPAECLEGSADTTVEMGDVPEGRP
jgi:tellurite resistance protein TerC